MKRKRNRIKTKRGKSLEAGFRNGFLNLRQCCLLRDCQTECLVLPTDQMRLPCACLALLAALCSLFEAAISYSLCGDPDTDSSGHRCDRSKILQTAKRQKAHERGCIIRRMYLLAVHLYLQLSLSFYLFLARCLCLAVGVKSASRCASRLIRIRHRHLMLSLMIVASMRSQPDLKSLASWLEAIVAAACS